MRNNGKIVQDGRIPVLNSLRAFAALSVCLYHFVCTTTGYIQTKWVLDFFSIGKYGVQLFFVISGFIIPWSMNQSSYRIRNFFSFLLKRLVRLEPPYVVSLFFAIFLLLMRTYILGQSENLQEISPTRIAIHFGYLIPFFKEYDWFNQVYWTLAIEFQYYLLIALAYIPIVNAGRLLRISMYLVFLGSSFIGGGAFLLHWLPVFLLGILVFLVKSKKIDNREFYVALLSVFMFCLWRYNIAEVVYMFIPVVGILFYEEYNNALGNWLGKMSYSLYLMHPLIGATFINVLSHHVQSSAGKSLVIIGGVILAIFSAWLTHRFIEGPSQKFSSKIKY